MRQILVAVAIALTVSILLTPALIRLFTKQGFGHQIREDGPPSHHTKRGTPSMGGVAILAAIWAGYLGTHLAGLAFDGEGVSASGLLVLGLATALGGVVLRLSPGGGTRLNPLERIGAREQREGLLEAIASATLQRPLAQAEAVGLAGALHAADQDHERQVAIPDVIAALRDPTPELAQRLATTPTDARLELRV